MWRATMANVGVEKDVTLRVIIDVLLLAISPVPSLIFKVAVNPFKRGFFCDDESISHPYRADTIPLWSVIVVGMVVPCLAMIPIEITRYRRHVKHHSAEVVCPYRFTIFKRPVHPFFVEVYKTVGPFLFAVAVCQVSTDIVKYSVGRLRPHFITVCQPDWGSFNCKDAAGNFRYITEEVCTGTEHVREARLSHPSGHSSQSFLCSVYFSLYLQSRLTWRGSRLLRYFIQAIVMYVAIYVCVSRISDYKHHWSDVLGGAVLGIVIALLVAYFVSDLFPRPKPKEMKKRLLEMQSFFDNTRSYSTSQQTDVDGPREHQQLMTIRRKYLPTDGHPLSDGTASDML